MTHECDEIKRLRAEVARKDDLLRRSKELMRDCVALISRQYEQIENFQAGVNR